MFTKIKWGGLLSFKKNPEEGKGHALAHIPHSSLAGIFLHGVWGQENKTSITFRTLRDHSLHVPSACPDLNFILNVACYKSPSLCGYPKICTNLSVVSAISWHSASSPYSHSRDRRLLLSSPLYRQANCSSQKLGTWLKLRFVTRNRLSCDANPHLTLNLCCWWWR